jgi:AmiR/NasT family two-component response regulator
VLAAGALLAAREMVVATEDRGAESSQRRWSERVARARRLLEGRRLVVVGGEQRADASDRLTEAFGLSGVSWVELTEHGSGAAMRAPIAQPDTALVLVLVKLAGHLHVDDARRYAKAAGKPVVMLTAGYNPERVALAVLSQASAQLAAVAEPG